MGRIITILGPHGVGKTTLQKYIRSNNLGLVYEGFTLEVDGLNLKDVDDYIKYEKKYLNIINEQNLEIKNSHMDGYTVRSIDEVEYYLTKHNPKIPSNLISELLDKELNIFSDYLIYLDASQSTLKGRIAGDFIRDQEETETWYNDEYLDYEYFWKNKNNLIVIDTNNKSTKEIFNDILLALKGE